MLVLLQVAYETFCQEREISWGRVCRIVEELELAA
jgi:hypothetical protein